MEKRRLFVALARQNPGRLNYASSGNGTIVQLTAELFKSQAKLFVVHIPYKGTALVKWKKTISERKITLD